MTVRIPRWALAAFTGMMLLVAVTAGGVANWLFDQRDQVQANRAAIHEIVREHSTIRERTIVSLVPAQTLDADPPATSPAAPRTTPTMRHTTPTTPPPPRITPPIVTVPTTTPGVIRGLVRHVLGAQGVPPHVWIPVGLACLILAATGLWWLFWVRPWL